VSTGKPQRPPSGDNGVLVTKEERVILLAVLFLGTLALRLLARRFASPDLRRFLFTARGIRATGPDGSYVRGDFLRGAALLLGLGAILVAAGMMIVVFGFSSPVHEEPVLVLLYGYVLCGIGALLVFSGLRYLYRAGMWRNTEDKPPS